MSVTMQENRTAWELLRRRYYLRFHAALPIELIVSLCLGAFIHGGLSLLIFPLGLFHVWEVRSVLVCPRCRESVARSKSLSGLTIADSCVVCGYPEAEKSDW